MLNEIIELLSNPEGMIYSVAVIAITFYALTGSFGVRLPTLKGHAVMLVLARTLVFALVFLALELLLDGVGYWQNIATTLIAAGIFALLFIDGNIPQRFALIISCVFSIMIMRSTITSAY